MPRKKEYFYSPVAGDNDNDNHNHDEESAAVQISSGTPSKKQSRRRRAPPPPSSSSSSPFPAPTSDDLVSQRLPFCLGLCVLLAIVYVLSRTSDLGTAVDKCDYSSVDMGAIRKQASVAGASRPTGKRSASALRAAAHSSSSRKSWSSSGKTS